MSIPRPTLKWLIPGILPRPGLTVLMGPPFSGKSYLSLQIALNLAEGYNPFHGTSIPSSRVLYLQLDTSELIWRDRLSKLQRSGVSLEVPVYMPHPDALPPPTLITSDETKAQLRAILQEVQPDVVMIDVLRELHQFEENDSTAQKIVFDHIQSVFAQYSLIILHHSKKVYGDITNMDPITLCRGSSYVPGRADAIWLLAGGRLKAVSRFAPEQVWGLTQQDNGFFLFGDVNTARPAHAAAVVADRKRDVVVDLYRKKPVEVSPSQYYLQHQENLTAQGISRSTFFRLLQGEQILPGPNH